MKIERLSHNKIKVTLSTDDLEEWNIDFEHLSYNSPETQEMFWNLMKQAEEETGFYVDESQLVVEAMPLESEGFVIMITRVDEEDDFESIHKYIKNKFRKSELRVRKKSKKIVSGLLVFAFSNFEDICLVSKRLVNIYFGDSTLYKYKEHYYLILTKNSVIDSNPENIEVILSDFGTKVNHPALQEGFLNEHATKIIENSALEVLNNYF